MNDRVSDSVGIGGLKAAATFTIPDGEDGSSVDLTDLGRNYMFLIIACEDSDGMQAGTDLTAEIGYAADDTAKAVYMDNGDHTEWSRSTVDAPTAWSFVTGLPFVGARRIRLKLSQVTSGAAVVFKIWGFDPVVER